MTWCWPRVVRRKSFAVLSLGFARAKRRTSVWPLRVHAGGLGEGGFDSGYAEQVLLLLVEGSGPPRAPRSAPSGEPSSASARSSERVAAQARARRSRGSGRRTFRASALRLVGVAASREETSPHGLQQMPAPRRRRGSASSAATVGELLGLVEPPELVERLREQRGDVRPDVVLVDRRERVVVGAELLLGCLADRPPSARSATRRRRSGPRARSQPSSRISSPPRAISSRARPKSPDIACSGASATSSDERLGLAVDEPEAEHLLGPRRSRPAQASGPRSAP